MTQQGGRYAGLLFLAHERGLVSLKAHFISVTPELALAEAETTFADAKTYGACADSTPQNVGPTASRLVMAGGALPTVQALMGHKTSAMTMRYTHLAPGHKRTAIAVLDRVQKKVPAIFPTGRKATA